MAQYLVLAKYIHLNPSLVSEDPDMVKIYDADDEQGAYDQFLKEYCPNVRDAQRFHNDVLVVELCSAMTRFRLTDKFGELAKFPNHSIFLPGDLFY